MVNNNEEQEKKEVQEGKGRLPIHMCSRTLAASSLITKTQAHLSTFELLTRLKQLKRGRFSNT